MIITKTTPFTKEEIKKVSEVFGSYIKTVIDIKKKICSAGCDRHYDSERILLGLGSNQRYIWGGGVDLETKIIDFNSLINIRPHDDNNSNEIQDKKIREEYKKLTEYFFKDIYGQK